MEAQFNENTSNVIEISHTIDNLAAKEQESNPNSSIEELHPARKIVEIQNFVRKLRKNKIKPDQQTKPEEATTVGFVDPAAGITETIETPNEPIEGTRIGKYGIKHGTRGVLDTRNKLNDLTGREWLYFQNSVTITGYSTTAKENMGFEIRKIHPSPKPPQLMRDIISFFTKKGEVVFDPFVGVGGTLLGASLCDVPRRAIGIDLSEMYLDAYRNVCTKYSIPAQTTICDDARNMFNHPEVAETTFDLILTDPPYSDMLNRVQNGQKKKLYGSNAPTPFTNSPLDIGNLNRDMFLKGLTEIISLAVQRLRVGKYLLVFCKDLQPQPETRELNLLHAEVAQALNTIPSITFAGMKIWHDQATSLYPFGYPYRLILNQMHQYILIFRKDK